MEEKLFVLNPGTLDWILFCALSEEEFEAAIMVKEDQVILTTLSGVPVKTITYLMRETGDKIRVDAIDEEGDSIIDGVVVEPSDLPPAQDAIDWFNQIVFPDGVNQRE